MASLSPPGRIQVTQMTLVLDTPLADTVQEVVKAFLRGEGLEELLSLRERLA
jgi:hypothetical protein